MMAGVVSFIAEWVAVELDFWSYNEKMPIVPLLEVGLSPFLAIVINPTLSFFLASKILVYNKKYHHTKIFENLGLNGTDYT
jgi:hypothetical protein